MRSIIHVGAHRGQEAKKYHNSGSQVVWVEAIPWIFLDLQEKIKKYKNQVAINALVSDKHDSEYNFKISNNRDGVSSSIYEFGKDGNEMFDISMCSSILLRSTTLKMLFDNYRLHKRNIEHMVLDVQGAELLVLKGAGSLLGQFKIIKTEVSTVEVYKDGVQWPELRQFLNNKGFKEVAAPSKEHCDVVFKRV